MTDRELTLLEKLRIIQNFKSGDPPPEWLGGPGAWGPPLSKLCGDAADEIENLTGQLESAFSAPNLRD